MSWRRPRTKVKPAHFMAVAEVYDSRTAMRKHRHDRASKNRMARRARHQHRQ